MLSEIAGNSEKLRVQAGEGTLGRGVVPFSNREDPKKLQHLIGIL